MASPLLLVLKKVLMLPWPLETPSENSDAATSSLTA
jgi:hypothetical protein